MKPANLYGKYTKPEPSNVRGICVSCPRNLQTQCGRNKAGDKTYRPICKPCTERDRPMRPSDPKYYTKFKKNNCERCGFVPEHTCQLDVDHVDGNKANTDPSNYQTLCANCHRLKTRLSREASNLKYRDAVRDLQAELKA